MHVLDQKDFFFKFQKDIPNERNALNRTDRTQSSMSKTGHKDQSVSISFWSQRFSRWRQVNNFEYSLHLTVC